MCRVVGATDSILVETMRREGFEMTVSPPSVLSKRDENGKNVEPLQRRSL